ncbi:thiolase family protein [Ostreibacterium oceani]|uniref:acetyl-CoA C-acyltransferase n=1 Tax=Ostreibacterium oceani TaxID=2654998 RepID=A0A6N7ES69_9GAMM|nr:thiolase family protein [Ostreibacterium oceani]MPV85342.1 acetyl-CoA C-acyltransferase [Ostreibacterium oceani]
MSSPAYIVAYARTPMGRAYKGRLQHITAPSLFGHAITHAVSRSGLQAESIDDVIMGCALPEGTQYYNIGRLSAMAAGLPVQVPGMTVDRQCASGLMAQAIAAMQVQTGQSHTVVAGGGEQLSLVQNAHMNQSHREDNILKKRLPASYLSMLETAEIVAKRYGISRHAQDELALLSQQRAASAQSKAIRQQEIAPISAAFLSQFSPSAPADEGLSVNEGLCVDENPRPTTTLDGLAQLTPVMDTANSSVTAGNACGFADGAAALVFASEQAVAKHQLKPLAIFHGVSVAGCEPDEMGVGPIYAVPKLLNRFGLGIGDIGLWELNEAFASQALYCINQLGLDKNKVNINGGAIALGHPYGMTGARLSGTAILTAQEKGAKYAVVTMCIGGGQGAAGLIEIL